MLSHRWPHKSLTNQLLCSANARMKKSMINVKYLAAKYKLYIRTNWPILTSPTIESPETTSRSDCNFKGGHFSEKLGAQNLLLALLQKHSNHWIQKKIKHQPRVG